jgi:hypothetical protein
VGYQHVGETYCLHFLKHLPMGPHGVTTQNDTDKAINLQKLYVVMICMWCLLNVHQLLKYLTQSEFEFSAMPKKIVNAKIACLDFSLQKAKMKLGVQVCFQKTVQFGYHFTIIVMLR